MTAKFKEKWNNGSITLVHLVGWGIGILTFAGGLTYTSYSATSNRLNGAEIKLAGQEATVSAIDKRLERIEDKLDKVLNR